MKPALLIINVPKQFLTGNSVMTQSLNDAVELINAAIVLFREKRLPVIAFKMWIERRSSSQARPASTCPTN